MQVTKQTPVNTLAPSFATFILSQCGDKQAAATIRMETVRAAVVVALKGNKTQWMDAVKAVADKKGTAAKAFRAGFLAVGDIAALFKPQDKVDAKVKAEAIAARADELVLIFEAAYQAELPAEKTADDKAKAKADRAAAQNAEIEKKAAAMIAEQKLVPADRIATDGEILAAALALITGGKCGDALADEFRAALGMESIRAAAFADGKAAALAELADKATGTETRRTAAKATGTADATAAA